MPNNLLNHRKQVFSSSMGEDGIIEHIFTMIKDIDRCNKCCVDIGAWDGIKISNTRNLIINHGWSSLQIECDPSRHEELVKNYDGYPVKTLCCYIDTLDNSFDRIIDRFNYSKIDFLSIDIDGADYDIFNSIEKYLPTLLCIEVSAGMNPFDCEVLPLEKATPLSGQSLGAMTNLAKSKGYQLVAFNGNAFYIKNELYPYLQITDNSIKTMYQNFIDIIDKEHKDFFIYWCNRFSMKNPFLK